MIQASRTMLRRLSFPDVTKKSSNICSYSTSFATSRKDVLMKKQDPSKIRNVRGCNPPEVHAEIQKFQKYCIENCLCRFDYPRIESTAKSCHNGRYTKNQEKLVSSAVEDVEYLQDGLWKIVLEVIALKEEMKRKDDRIQELESKLEEILKPN